MLEVMQKPREAREKALGRIIHRAFGASRLRQDSEERTIKTARKHRKKAVRRSVAFSVQIWRIERSIMINFPCSEIVV